MIALRNSGLSPIGLVVSDRTVTLAQVQVRPGTTRVHALAQGDLDAEIPSDDSRRPAAIVDLIGHLIRRHGFRGRQVISCLGADELFVQNVRVPQLPPEEVAKVVAWEAEERLPYPGDEAEIRHLLAGEVRQDSTVRQEVIMLACRKELVQRQIDLLEQARLIPVAVDVEPCAVMRALHTQPESAAGRVAYLDLGERSTSVMFADAERPLFLKYIATGGRQMDDAVARDLDVSPAEAARVRSLVRSAHELNSDDDIHRSVINAVRPTLEALVRDIELCLRYFKVTFRGQVLDKIVVSGSEATRWLATFFGQRLGQECVLADPLEGLQWESPDPTVADRPWQWTTALGLALREKDDTRS